MVNEMESMVFRRRDRHGHFRLGLSLAIVFAGCVRHVPDSRPPEQLTPIDLAKRGMLFARGGDDVRAEHYLTAALESGADADQVLPELIGTCVRAERYSTALQYAEDYLPLVKRVQPLRKVLAGLYLALGQIMNAKVVLEEVVATEKDAQAHLLLGEIYAEHLGHFSKADNHFQAFLALAPEHPRAENVRQRLLRSTLTTVDVPTNEGEVLEVRP